MAPLGSSFLALLIAVPLAIGVAIFLTEMCPRFLRGPLAFFTELLAAIPSVVYGLWAVFVLVPLLREHVNPFLAKTLGWTGFFGGPNFGIGMLAAGVILAIMILPIVSSLTREVMTAVPHTQREAVLALGATRWEMIRMGVLRNARIGIVGSVILGLGRALGETMAVTMVIGNRPEIAKSLFAPGYSMASVIANEFSEATDDLYLSALIEIGLALFHCHHHRERLRAPAGVGSDARRAGTRQLAGIESMAEWSNTSAANRIWRSVANNTATDAGRAGHHPGDYAAGRHLFLSHLQRRQSR